MVGSSLASSSTNNSSSLVWWAAKNAAPEHARQSRWLPPTSCSRMDKRARLSAKNQFGGGSSSCSNARMPAEEAAPGSLRVSLPPQSGSNEVPTKGRDRHLKRLGTWAAATARNDGRRRSRSARKFIYQCNPVDGTAQLVKFSETIEGTGSLQTGGCIVDDLAVGGREARLSRTRRRTANTRGDLATHDRARHPGRSVRRGAPPRGANSSLDRSPTHRHRHVRDRLGLAGHAGRVRRRSHADRSP